MPNFSYHNGRLLTNVQLVTIFARTRVQNNDGTFASPNWVDATTGQPAQVVCTWNDALRDLISSAYLRLVGTEYSVPGGPQIGTGHLIASCTIELPIVQPADNPNLVITHVDVEAMIEDAIQNGTIPPPNDNTCVMVFFAGTNVTDPEGGIVGVNAGGFHSVFQTQGGINTTYCVIDAGSDRTIRYASHELVEAITDSDNGGQAGTLGWYDNSTGEEIADVCFAFDDKNGVPSFHNQEVSSFWSRTQNKCVVPADDKQITLAPTLRISMKANSIGCVVQPLPGASAKFMVSASVAGNPDKLRDIQWTPDDGARLVGRFSHGVSCQIDAPPAPGPFSITVTATDEFGCQLTGQQVFICISAEEAAWQQEICKIRHEILKKWKLLNPIWGPPELPSATDPIRKVDLLRIHDLVGLLNRLAKQLKEFPTRKHNSH